MTNIIDLIVRLLATLIRLLSPNESQGTSDDSSNDSSGEKSNNSGRKDGGKLDDEDPFKILGLDGGEANTTIEEAKKVRRKLALKWHPDRNTGNEEEATEKIQEINNAFAEVEKILGEGSGTRLTRKGQGNKVEMTRGLPREEQNGIASGIGGGIGERKQNSREKCMMSLPNSIGRIEMPQEVHSALHLHRLQQSQSHLLKKMAEEWANGQGRMRREGSRKEIGLKLPLNASIQMEAMSQVKQIFHFTTCLLRRDARSSFVARNF